MFFLFYRDSNFVLQSDLEEDESTSEPRDQNITNSQNESDTLNINESAFVSESVHSSQSNDSKTKGIKIILVI